MNKNTHKLREKQYFRLTNFYLATFLLTKGLDLVNIDRTDPKRSQFVFLDTPRREVLVQNYNFSKEDSSEVVVDPRKFIMAIKTLKDRLYQNY